MTANTITNRLDAVAPETLLRFSLKLDAIPTALNGLAYIVLAGVLDSALGLPGAYLLAVGAAIFAYGCGIWFVATRPAVPRAGAWAAVELNAAFVLGSLATLVFGVFDTTTAGTVWLLAQAALVADLALLQWYALRRASR